MKAKIKKTSFTCGHRILLIIVLQYVENKMQIREMRRGELTMSFSNHGPLIKQLDCHCIITENKKML